LIECIDKLEATVIIVSNEVGLGLVSENRLGRLYRDILGRTNQLLAQHADEVYVMVAGIPLKVKEHKGYYCQVTLGSDNLGSVQGSFQIARVNSVYPLPGKAVP
ncbi:unnamed protein product, partial [marine sediment metagenome]